MSARINSAKTLSTIGYEGSDLGDFVATLQENRIEVLCDIRERAQSRKKGFSKTALSQALERVGIRYVHKRSLGDPKPGREAARAGKWELFATIYAKVIESKMAQEALAEVEVLARQKSIALLCYEQDHLTCHRSIVADRLAESLDKTPVHLRVTSRDAFRKQQGRVLHPRQSSAAPV